MGSSPMLRRVGLLALLPTCLLGLASQYPDLNALRSAYDGDLEILCVPSSNFFNQEPSGTRQRSSMPSNTSDLATTSSQTSLSSPGRTSTVRTGCRSTPGPWAGVTPPSLLSMTPRCCTTLPCLRRTSGGTSRRFSSTGEDSLTRDLPLLLSLSRWSRISDISLKTKPALGNIFKEFA